MSLAGRYINNAKKNEDTSRGPASTVAEGKRVARCWAWNRVSRITHERCDIYIYIAHNSLAELLFYSVLCQSGFSCFVALYPHCLLAHLASIAISSTPTLGILCMCNVPLFHHSRRRSHQPGFSIPLVPVLPSLLFDTSSLLRSPQPGPETRETVYTSKNAHLLSGSTFFTLYSRTDNFRQSARTRKKVITRTSQSKERE